MQHRTKNVWLSLAAVALLASCSQADRPNPSAVHGQHPAAGPIVVGPSLSAGHAALPAGHPPVPRTAPALPPGHPPVLPEGHPPIFGEDCPSGGWSGLDAAPEPGSRPPRTIRT